jgi:predicted nucleotidyltransferase
MMTYDAEDWLEMQAEFEKAIPNLTITKDALIQAELEQAKDQLKNVPTIEQLQAQLKEAGEQKKQMQDMASELARIREEMARYDRLGEVVAEQTRQQEEYIDRWRKEHSWRRPQE